MNIPGLLIEYLMTGCMAVLLWYSSLEKVAGTWENSDILGNQVVGALVIIPLVYVIGSIIDFIGTLSLIYPKRIIRNGVRNWWRDAGRPLPDIDDEKLITTYLLSTNHALGKEFEERSSRDRIARGAAFVLIVSAAIEVYLNNITQSSIYFLIALLLFAVWYRAEKSSFRFKLQAWYLSTEKGCSEISP